MKTKITLLILFITVIGYSQNGINYKALIKNDLGSVVANESIFVQFAVLEGGITNVYTETHNPTTDDNGIIIINIGEGTPTSGNFSTIDWGADRHFLQTSITYTGGIINFDATEFRVVPYALHAKTAENVDITGNEAAFDDWDKDAADDFDGEYSSLNGKPTQTISIPAYAMGRSPSSTIITEAGIGLEWENNFTSSANIVVKKPDNYISGTVEFSIFFLASSNASGVVQFFIRPRSFNTSDSFTDSSSVVSDGVNVSATTGFGTTYEQKITIPANRLVDDWWYISIQRNIGSYTDDVTVMSAALTYNQ